LIFVETRRDANSVENQLIREGFDAISIHGDRTQKEREHALSVFRSGKCPVLVATDVAARGLDIPNVKWVVNYDLPNNVEAYVHRIGRTGRCGHEGNAVAFVNDKNKPILQDLVHLLRETKQEVPQWFSEMVYQNRRDPHDNRQWRRDYRTDHAKDYRHSQGSKDSNFTSRRYNEGGHHNRNRGDFNREREKEKSNWSDNKEWKNDSFDRDSDKMRSFNNSESKPKPFGDNSGHLIADPHSTWDYARKDDSWGN